MTADLRDPFETLATLNTPAGRFLYHRLERLQNHGFSSLETWPVSIRILLESVLRSIDGHNVSTDHLMAFSAYSPTQPTRIELPFMPARVILQDFTGVPCVVDLAAMRSEMARMGGDPSRINPLIPVDLVIDHSVQVDVAGRSDALAINARIEFERNAERYEFLKWGQTALRNFSVVPPSIGIVHQVNLERLAKVVQIRQTGETHLIYPDSLVGTDSHTTMINGLGVIGWGVGGIEAEAVMLGQPYFMLTPEVIGVRLTGCLRPDVNATDLALTVTQLLRRVGVVDRIVEFFGPGVASMPLPDRATIANMAPEYGATMGYFPVDAETLRYLKQTGRPDKLITQVEYYYKEQGLFHEPGAAEPSCQKTIELDLGTIEPSVAGPKRPQDRVPLKQVKQNWASTMIAPVAERGYAIRDPETVISGSIDGRPFELKHGSVVIAAITSCTNTSNPSVMLSAGLVARNAVRVGLSVPSHVKTSLAPGSKVVTEYLKSTGLMPYLETLGFHVAGYGCTTCIGNSGPLPNAICDAIEKGDLVVASVLSGNRNFEGRIHAQTRANYLASPPLVVIYALAGTVNIDLDREPIGTDRSGSPVFLRNLLPNAAELTALLNEISDPARFQEIYARIYSENETWNRIPVRSGALFDWQPGSTYIQEPPYLRIDSDSQFAPIQNARTLVKVGDSVTTDHISPAGTIPEDSPAGRYLVSQGVNPSEFNSYGSRRGNDRVMTRGTFANIRLKNLLLPGTEGGMTVHIPSMERMSVFEAAERYRNEQTPCIVLAGKDYGMGSSRDWAAKGTRLLGVRAVIAESFERIHRSNLIGMGILPLVFLEGETAQTLGLTGFEEFSIRIDSQVEPGQRIEVAWRDDSGRAGSFWTICRIDTLTEKTYYRHGGILPAVLHRFLSSE